MLSSLLPASALAIFSLSLAAGCGEPEPMDSSANPPAAEEAADPFAPAGIIDAEAAGRAADFHIQATIDKTKAASVLTLINAKRKSGYKCPDGVTYPPAPALVTNTALTKAAEGNGADMADKNYFSHTGLNGSTPATRAKAAGYTSYTYPGENIAAGYDTPDKAVAGWLASTGHCQNLMNKNFKSTGIGVANNASSTYKWYWVQMFGNP
jgi:uncharacterized protein YkwD